MAAHNTAVPDTTMKHDEINSNHGIVQDLLLIIPTGQKPVNYLCAST
jgi:hypothetical protein